MIKVKGAQITHSAIPYFVEGSPRKIMISFINLEQTIDWFIKEKIVNIQQEELET